METSHRLSPGDSKSDTDLYVSNEFSDATKKNFVWKSTNIGAVTLRILPQDPHYVTGWYYIGVYGYKPGMNLFSLLVNLSDPSMI